MMLLLGEVLHKGKTYIDVCGKISLSIRYDDEEREHSNPVDTGFYVFKLLSEVRIVHM